MKPIEIDDEHYRELDHIEHDELSTAAARVDGGFGSLNPGVVRYVFYRRKGYDKPTAMAYALAWAHNATEQYDRRLQHDTGAEGWRPVI